MLSGVVPVTGVEPVRCCHRGILSPMRLPIPPHRQNLEAPPRFELGVKDLQSSALPLGYGATSRNYITTVCCKLQDLSAKKILLPRKKFPFFAAVFPCQKPREKLPFFVSASERIIVCRTKYQSRSSGAIISSTSR